MSAKVNKTYKLFINGSFQRTESGRYYERKSADQAFLANMPKGSRKDVRNAIQFARSAQLNWQNRTAYNKSQIVYRIAEMLQQEEYRFLKLLEYSGFSKKDARADFDQSIENLIHLAGWCDKYIQIAGTVNPVASSHFNFSVPEPTGVVCTNLPIASGLNGITNALIPAVCGGNTVVCLAEQADFLALDFSEIISNSDVPSGVVNIITGKMPELVEHVARHMDVNALLFWDVDIEMQIKIEHFGLENMKRVYFSTGSSHIPAFDLIMKFQEIKTTWHPIDRIEGSGSGY